MYPITCFSSNVLCQFPPCCVASQSQVFQSIEFFQRTVVTFAIVLFISSIILQNLWFIYVHLSLDTFVCTPSRLLPYNRFLWRRAQLACRITLISVLSSHNYFGSFGRALWSFIWNLLNRVDTRLHAGQVERQVGDH